MQEQLNGPNKNKPEDAKRPRQGNSVRAGTRRERDSRDIDPEACDRDDRKDVNDHDPSGKSTRLDHAAPAELDHENEGEGQCGGCAGERPGDAVRNMNDGQKRGNQGKCGDHEATFNVEAHEAQMPIGELLSQRTPKSDNH